MQYLEACSNDEAVYRTRLFLAGGITNCADWQAEVVEALKDKDITIYNPRRKDFDTANKDHLWMQIAWEHKRLREATNVLFWFCKETPCPITLFEYGAALERLDKQNVLVGSDPEYGRFYDLKQQTALQVGHSNIYTDLNRMIAYLKKEPLHRLLNPGMRSGVMNHTMKPPRWGGLVGDL